MSYSCPNVYSKIFNNLLTRKNIQIFPNYYLFFVKLLNILLSEVLILFFNLSIYGKNKF